ncbi:MAG: hypothetical protein AAGF49_11905, partial [Pseudomonadota bacterium]
ELRGLDVSARLHWSGEQEGREPYVSAPEAFDLDVEIDSDADTDRLVALIDAAKKGCFIEQSLAMGVKVGHRLKVDGGWREA